MSARAPKRRENLDHRSEDGEKRVVVQPAASSIPRRPSSSSLSSLAAATAEATVPVPAPPSDLARKETTSTASGSSRTLDLGMASSNVTGTRRAYAEEHIGNGNNNNDNDDDNSDNDNNEGGDDDLLMGWNHQVRRRMSNQSAASGGRNGNQEEEDDNVSNSDGDDNDQHQQQQHQQQQQQQQNRPHASSSSSSAAGAATSATAAASAPTAGQRRNSTSSSTSASRSGSGPAATNGTQNRAASSTSTSTSTRSDSTSKPKKKPRRNVRFNPSVRFVRVRGRWQYTPTEAASVWYDQDEYDDIRHRMRRSVKRMRKRLQRSGLTTLSANTIALLELETERESTRGLEHLTSIPVLEQHREEYELVKHRVLSTQAEQWKTGNLCVMEIARASRSVTEESSTRAVRKAIKDTIDASQDIMALDGYGRNGAAAGVGTGGGNNSLTNLDPQATLRRATAATMTATLHSSMDETSFRRYNSSDYPSSGASGVPTISRSSQNGGGGSSGSRRRSSTGESQGDGSGGERSRTSAGGSSSSAASRSQPTSTAAPVLNRRSSADDPRQWQLRRQLDQRNPSAVSSSTANGGMIRSRSMAASLAQQRDAILNSLNFADNGHGSSESGSGGSGRGNAGFFAQSGGRGGSGGTASSSSAARSGRAMLSRGGDGGGQRAVSSSSSNAQDMPRAARSLNDIMSNMRLGGGGGGGGSGG